MSALPPLPEVPASPLPFPSLPQVVQAIRSVVAFAVEDSVDVTDVVCALLQVDGKTVGAAGLDSQGAHVMRPAARLIGELAQAETIIEDFGLPNLKGKPFARAVARNGVVRFIGSEAWDRLDLEDQLAVMLIEHDVQRADALRAVEATPREQVAMRALQEALLARLPDVPLQLVHLPLP